MSSSTGMIGIDSKKGDRVDLTRPLVRFIRGAFPEKVEDIMVGIEDLTKMRDTCINPEKSEKGVDSLLRYYLQLTSMDSKLPINENQIHITFTWYDAFYKDSVFSGKRGSQSNSLFERSAILFNVGALSSQIAAVQNLDTDDGLKVAAKYFQVSSGAFSHLRDKLVPMLQKISTPDLSIEVLSSLTLLMQAQAQECIYHKAVADKMKEKVTCRLAASGMDLYSEAYRAMSGVSMKGSSWDKWTATCLAKQNYMAGLAEYYQSLNAKEAKAIGEELSRLKEADKCLSDAVKQSSGNFECKDIQSKVNRALQAAEKDNNFIYHERVPNIKDLPAIGRAPVAKPTPLPTQLEGWSDVFAALVPLNVQQAATMYASRKDHLIHLETNKLKEATNQLNSVLNQMNLPAALEDLSGKEMPVSLIEKGGDVRTKGGIMQLRQLFDELPLLLQRNEEILRDTVKSIDDEENNDKHLRSQFGEKWQRTKSEDINKNMREQGQKYQQFLDNAKNADKIVREKFEKNYQAIDVLSKDETELINSIPPGGAQSLSQEGQKAVATLKSFLDQVKLLKGERDALEEKFKTGGDTEEIVSKFSQLNVENNLFNDEAISTEQLEKVYGPLQAAVVDSIKSQDDMIAKITTANDEFVKSRSGSTSDPRSEAMTNLATGYDAFIELQSNLQEGNKFYNNLTKILTTFQSQVNDFVFARNTEKEDLMKTLQTNIAKAAPPARPAPPTFHQQAPAATPPASTSAAAAPPTQLSLSATSGLNSGPTPQAPPIAPPAAPQSYGAAYYQSGVQGYTPSYGYPPTQYGGYYTYPGHQYPPGQYPYGQYPPAQYPPGQYPPAQYPPGQQPPYTGPK